MLDVPGLERRDSVMTGSSMDSSGRLPCRREKWKERLNTELLRAVSASDMEKAAKLLESGACPSARCREGLVSCLHLAASQGSRGLLELLLSSGGDPEVRDRAGRQPHHLAAGAGHLLALSYLLSSRPALLDSQVHPPQDQPPPGALDSWNHRHADFIDLVPEAAGIGITALHLASDRGDWRMVDILLRNGANPKIPDMNGLLALDVAGEHYGEPPAAPPPKGEGAARSLKPMRPMKTTAFDGPDEGAAVRPVEEVCTLLMARGAEFPKTKVIIKDEVIINQRRMKVTALHTAVSRQDHELAKFLLSRGACPLTWNEEGLTAVHLAVRGRDEDGLALLLEYGAAEARDVFGRTPLLQAVQEGWSDGVAGLLEAGSDTNSTTNTNQTVLHLAAQTGWVNILRELLSITEINKILDRTNNSHETPLSLAVKTQNLECVKVLCESGSDPNFLLLPGDQSLLHIAVLNDSSEILQCLLRVAGKSRINLMTRDERGGLTPLHISAAEGYADCCDELLTMGADPRVRTKRGDTALHLAARAGHVEVVRLLVRRDRDLMDARNNDGWNALHVAAAEGNTECAKAMILQGADLSARVKFEMGEKTAVDIICLSIPKAAEFLEDTLNEYLEVVKGPINDPDCEILLNFEILMPNGENEKQMNVIGAVMDCERQTVIDKIMLHPLIECFLYLKWKKFKLFFFFIMLLYFVLTVSLTTIAHLTFVEKNTSILHKTLSIVSRVILCLVLVPVVFVEFANFCQLKRHYFTDYESWVKWTVIVCTCVVESVSSEYFWARYLASVAVLLSWIEMLFLLSRCPSWGFYVLMFSRVSTKILKVLATFSFLILGFAFSFLILFEARVPFRNLLESVVKVLVMMIEFDYEDMFNGSTGDIFSMVGRLMFAAFVLLVAMVTMNLMLGVAVSDISRLESQGRTQQLAKQAAFLAFLEGFLYTRRTKRLKGSWKRRLSGQRAAPRTLLIRPGKPSSSQVVLPRAHLENILFSLKTRNVGKLDISNSLKDISDGVDRMAVALRDFYAEQRKSSAFRSNRDFERILDMILNEQKAIRENIGRNVSRNVEKIKIDALHFPDQETEQKIWT